MKVSKKLIVLLAAAMLVAAVMPTALAVSDTAAAPGETATLTFTFSNVYNVDGVFTVYDPQEIVSGYTVSVADAGSTSAVVSGNYFWAQPTAEPVSTSVSVTVLVALKSGAASGAACTVSFSGIYGSGSETPGNEHDVYQAATVTVRGSSTGAASGDTGSESVTTPPETTQTPTTPAIDTTEVDRQMTIVNGLNELDYTAESWAALQQALELSAQAIASQDQAAVDASAVGIAAAVNGLSRMDYSLLRQVIAEVDRVSNDISGASIWMQMTDAVANGEALLDSLDQAAVDEAAAWIEDLLAQAEVLQAEQDAAAATPPAGTEVEVEVLPTDDYCNMTSHRVWPVLFFISLAVNIGLAVLIVVYVAKKRRKQRDNTPLVDYDIDDDL